jgi:hypothetical protein
MNTFGNPINVGARIDGVTYGTSMRIYDYEKAPLGLDTLGCCLFLFVGNGTYRPHTHLDRRRSLRPAPNHLQRNSNRPHGRTLRELQVLDPN